jgi:hypothetical protein
MPITYYNESPYWDDFNQNKNYLRVLFRPGYSVQARELTQLQTALQAQIARFGDHFFKDGSKVMGGLATLNNKLAFVKVRASETNNANVQTTYSTLSYTGNSATYLQTDPVTGQYVLIGSTIYGTTNGLSARIIDIAPPTNEDNNIVLFVEYLSSGGKVTTTNGITTDTTGVIKAFAADEYLITQRTVDEVTTYIAFRAKSLENGHHPNGFGTRLSVDEGVYYVKGCFVHTPASSIIISRYRTNPFARVIYSVTENKVTPVMDTTLNDNALGSPNVGAPGAHRYQIAMDLAIENWNPALYDENVDNRILVAIIENGTIKKEGRTEYAEIMKTLAQRTFEESGNYVLNPFRLSVREYLNDFTNDGLYTEAQIQGAIRGIDNATEARSYAANKLAIGLDPSVAYINGYRVELQSTVHTPIKKARKYEQLNNIFVSAEYGNYAVVTLLRGLPDIAAYSTINLNNSGNSLVGSARVRSIQYISGTGDTATYKVYLFDVTILPNHQLSEIAKLANGSGFTANLVTAGVITDAANNSLVFKLPTNVTKSATDLTYRVRQTFTASASATTVTLSPTTANQYFVSESASDYVVVKTDGTAFGPGASGAYVICPASVQINAPTGGNTYNSVTLTFAANVLTNGGNVKVVATCQRATAAKTKTLTDAFITIDTPNIVAGGYDSLAQVDIHSVSAIRMSPDTTTPVANDAAWLALPDILDRYTIDNGQRDNYYDYGTVTLKAGVNPPTGKIRVYFKYFAHGSPGDYFSVASYGNDYEKIPAFQSSNGVVELRDCIDFRPSINAWNETVMAAPSPSITCDLSYYLPRIDKVYMDQFGNVKVTEGIASLTPKAPDDVTGTMTLYTLSIPAYTFTPSSVLSKMIDHRRYTMRDIGRIEKRVQKLEYYTALSLLEKETANQQILDNDGYDRYKNGFVVDNFTGHGIGAVTHPDYTAAIDKNAGVLRPMFWEDSVNLRLDSTNSSGYRQTGPLVTLNYYSAPIINQPYASYIQSVNPFAVNSWVGTIKMFPSTDEWKETTVAPQVIMDNGAGTYDSIKNAQDPEIAIGTLWNEWATNWNGLDTNSGSDSSRISVGGGSTTDSITSWDEFLKSRTNLSGGELSALNPEIQSTYIANRAVETNLVPYIRSRKIYFKAVGLKPNTKFYAFFDGRNVGPFVRQETEIPAWALNYSGTNTSMDPTFINYNSSTFVTDYINYTSHPDSSTSLYSNARGELYGSFILPNTEFIRFKSGKKIFRLIDIGNNNNKLATSVAEGQYDARGTFLGQQSASIVSMRSPDVCPMKMEGVISDAQFIAPNKNEGTQIPEIPKPPLPPNPPVDVVVVYDQETNEVVLDEEETTVYFDPSPDTPEDVVDQVVVCPPETDVWPPLPVIGCVFPENTEVAPAVIAANPNCCPDGSLKGWYPGEAFGQAGGLIWSCPPQPRITPEVHEQVSGPGTETVGYGWYPSEAYGGAPGGLVYGPPPTPNTSGQKYSSNNNTPDDTGHVYEEPATASDMVGEAFDIASGTDYTPQNETIITCVHPNEWDTTSLNQTISVTEIEPDIYPGLPDSPGGDVVFYVGEDEANVNDVYEPYMEYYPEYNASTIYIDEGAQVSYEAFDEEYNNDVQNMS